MSECEEGIIRYRNQLERKLISFGDALHMVGAIRDVWGIEQELHMVHPGFSPLRNRAHSSGQGESYQMLDKLSVCLALYGSKALTTGCFYIPFTALSNCKWRNGSEGTAKRDFTRAAVLSASRLPILPLALTHGDRVSKSRLDGF